MDLGERELSLAEDKLTLLVLAYVNAKCLLIENLFGYISRGLGWEAREGTEDQQLLEFLSRLLFTNLIAGLMVRRLKQDDRSVPLISVEDAQEVFSSIGAVEYWSSVRLTNDVAGRHWRASFWLYSSMVGLTTMPGANSYDSAWKWIMVVLDLAEEYGLSLAEFFSLPGSSDLITKRIFTKAGFLKRFNPRSDVHIDLSELEQIINRLTGVDISQQGANEEQVECKEMLDRLENQSKNLVLDWAKEEADRIWGPD